MPKFKESVGLYDRPIQDNPELVERLQARLDKAISEQLRDNLHEAYEEGRRDERRAIVEFIRRDAEACTASVPTATRMDGGYASSVLAIVARDIENEEHLP